MFEKSEYLHEYEQGREEQQRGPLDSVQHRLQVLAVRQDQQQDRAQQRRPAQGHAVWEIPDFSKMLLSNSFWVTVDKPCLIHLLFRFDSDEIGN